MLYHLCVIEFYFYDSRLWYQGYLKMTYHLHIPKAIVQRRLQRTRIFQANCCLRVFKVSIANFGIRRHTKTHFFLALKVPSSYYEPPEKVFSLLITGFLLTLY